MVKLIVGKKGKGKTKEILKMVNTEIKEVDGNIVYLDKCDQFMYELNNKVRLIDTSEYSLENSDEFIGFLQGILSQDHDLQQMYLDSFLKIASVDESNIEKVVAKLEKISDSYKVDFILSVSMSQDEISEDLKQKVIVAL
jgi:ABC-type phosphate/phosphonate transport system ATPase subunit